MMEPVKDKKVRHKDYNERFGRGPSFESEALSAVVHLKRKANVLG